MPPAYKLYAYGMTALGTTPRRYLVDVRPDLAAQLHPIMNSGVDLALVISGSSKNVWWLGECGHEWPGSPGHRVSHSGANRVRLVCEVHTCEFGCGHSRRWF
jgi:hypothetical protein